MDEQKQTQSAQSTQGVPQVPTGTQNGNVSQTPRRQGAQVDSQVPAASNQSDSQAQASSQVQAQQQRAQSQNATTAPQQPDQLQQLTQLADQEESERLEPQAPQGQQAAPQDVNDPLKKLLGMVKGDDEAIDKLKVKSLFVTVGNKLAHNALEKIVAQYREQGMPENGIVDMLLYLDKQVEQGELTEELFEYLDQNGKW